MCDGVIAQIGGVSALAEPARRALYFYVVAQPRAVSRDQAAKGAGLPLHSAKFHLDRLVEEGLLETEFRRLTGRRGPGAGRPSKLYRRSDRQISVSLPERHYDLAGQILARAIEESATDGTPIRQAVARAAAEAGHTLGTRSRARALAVSDETTTDPGIAKDARTDLSAAATALAELGYEPRIEEDRIVLANCPFHALAKDHVELVCGMNVDLIGALLDEIGAGDIAAGLDPAPGRCCVTLTRTAG